MIAYKIFFSFCFFIIATPCISMEPAPQLPEEIYSHLVVQSSDLRSAINLASTNTKLRKELFSYKYFDSLIINNPSIVPSLGRQFYLIALSSSEVSQSAKNNTISKKIIQSYHTQTIQLIPAVKNNDIKKVANLLEQGANSNYTDARTQYTPALHIACKNGNVAMAQLLLRHGAKVNAVNEYGETALFESINLNLFNLNAAQDDQERKDMILHSKQVEHKLLFLLVDNGIDVNKPNKSGRIALEDACFEGNLHTVRFLIEHGGLANQFCLDISNSPFTSNARQIRALCLTNLHPDVSMKINRNRAMITTLYFVCLDYAATHYIDNPEHFLDISYLPSHLLNLGSHLITLASNMFS